MKNYKYILTHSPGNLTLEYNPINWNTINILFKRSERYHSVLRSQILDVEFPRDGKSYVDTIYETYGIDTEIGCEIQYLKKSDFTYATLFTGIIDLSEWVNRRDTTTVKISDSSVMAKFAARDEISIPLNRTTDLDGTALSSYTYLNTMSVEGVDILQYSRYDNRLNSIAINTTGVITLGDYIGVSDDGYDLNDNGDNASLPAEILTSAADGIIYTNNSGGDEKITYNLKTSISGTIDVIGSGSSWVQTLRCYAGISSGTIVINLDKSGTGADSRSFNQSYSSGDITVTLADGASIYFYHYWGLTGTDNVNTDFAIKPTFVQVHKTVAAKAETEHSMPLLHELGAKLLEVMTGKSNPLNAPLLGRTDSEPRTYASDGVYSLTGVASGNILRGRDNPLTTTFYDYFKSLDTIYNLGIKYDPTNSEFDIVTKEDLFKDTKIITLGEVKDLEVSVASDEYFNKITCGYKDKLDYEGINGNQTFNVNTEFANDTKIIPNTLDLQSIYHTDDYGIELARKNADINSTKDSKRDDLIYLITGKRDSGAYQTLQGYEDGFTVIKGVYSPYTRLNLNITPKRNLLRWANVLAVPLFKSSGDTNYMTKQFSLDLETKKSTEAANIVEKADLAYTDLEQPIYYPEVYNFTAPLTNANVLQLLLDPHGYVEFDYIGTTYSGFILEVSTEPFNRTGNWTLIKRNPSR